MRMGTDTQPQTQKTMIEAILTIDDIASKNTRALVDYLCEKKIKTVMFAWGSLVEANYENAIYALKKGMIVGNHSYSHPQFSELSFEEAVSEIEKNEEVLNRLYSDAGVERKYKLFRFPYGDKGGNNKDALQNYLKENGFTKPDDSKITFDWYDENGFRSDVDTYWTFDFAEWQIRKGSGFGKDDVISRIDEFIKGSTATPDLEKSQQLLLIHAHDETEELVPEYYKTFIEYAIQKGVHFIDPVIR